MMLLPPPVLALPVLPLLLLVLRLLPFPLPLLCHRGASHLSATRCPVRSGAFPIQIPLLGFRSVK